MRPFAFAGVWSEEPAAAGGEGVRACAILTTEANQLVRDIHERMPVMLGLEGQETWLRAEDPARLRGLFRPYPAEEMEAVRVSSYVNGANAEGPRCSSPSASGACSTDDTQGARESPRPVRTRIPPCPAPRGNAFASRPRPCCSRRRRTPCAGCSDG